MSLQFNWPPFWRPSGVAKWLQGESLPRPLWQMVSGGGEGLAIPPPLAFSFFFSLSFSECVCMCVSVDGPPFPHSNQCSATRNCSQFSTFALQFFIPQDQGTCWNLTRLLKRPFKVQAHKGERRKTFCQPSSPCYPSNWKSNKKNYLLFDANKTAWASSQL